LTAESNPTPPVAPAADSVKLPAAYPGLTIVVINTGSNPMQVFGTGSDTINGVAAATGVSQMQSAVVFYASTVAGKWFTEGIATGFSGSLQTSSAVNALTAFAGGGQGSATP